ncbi:MAG: DNA polymerase III subunit alpha, partial [Deltaproteobacteria bacterium CG_4_8_14_3_um_filter_43_13]
MDKTKMAYFKDEDILHIVISEEKEADSVEIS